jgi:hypothetical protein
VTATSPDIGGAVWGDAWTRRLLLGRSSWH